MLVLRVKDTDLKHHVEVRGKKNYEIDGYDPKDKLHSSTRQIRSYQLQNCMAEKKYF